MSDQILLQILGKYILNEKIDAYVSSDDVCENFLEEKEAIRAFEHKDLDKMEIILVY